jgi:molecular chaperone HscB
VNFVPQCKQEMNYFELYNMPVTMKPDVQQVKQKFYELSRRYHPDFFANATAEEQIEALEKSSLINRAFKVLQQPDETIKYVLQLHGLLEEEEKNQLPGAFLATMLDLNEQIAEAKMDEDATALQQIQSTIYDIQSNLYEPVRQIVEHYQEGVTAKEELLQVKDYYYKKKYLTRILAGMH